MKVVKLEVDKAIKDYKKFEDFKLLVAEGCLDSDHLGFFRLQEKGGHGLL